MSERPKLVIVPGDARSAHLKLSRAVRDEYGLPTLGKPCVAYALDGNLGAAARHKAAFVIAIECRALGLTRTRPAMCSANGHARSDTRSGSRMSVLFATLRKDRRAAAGATTPPESSRSRARTPFEVLGPVCAELGCPANCPAYAGRPPAAYADKGSNSSTGSAGPIGSAVAATTVPIDVYRALCDSSTNADSPPGHPSSQATRNSANSPGRSRTPRRQQPSPPRPVNGLLAEYEPGSGSGPHAHDRNHPVTKGSSSSSSPLLYPQ